MTRAKLLSGTATVEYAPRPALVSAVLSACDAIIAECDRGLESIAAKQREILTAAEPKGTA